MKQENKRKIHNMRGNYREGQDIGNISIKREEDASKTLKLKRDSEVAVSQDLRGCKEMATP